ncbi:MULTISPECIES: SDR family oxidoreductase [unclassified Pseudofrankia]|uniref:SDR family NAD(P)-dependent oxidoreductase n=1 Tax=unclassified Pseudofrankia TaxID=2994372 RepID=UPI0008D9A28B|nr:MULTISPECIES: SDR family NAD(P)-dependent oxidoreductase [unclassified Pseudofrankia]MDT3443727.1 SDR family NAD(P)-dependent oxidoreductase [Pseudofrankia sp. BMG5.37]OHV50049.1 acetoin dehydrogenase [Pseudofrankia sp. BMG5.36]
MTSASSTSSTSTLRGKVAVVTGAGSGIGRSLALAIARRAGRLSVCDVNADGLAETVEAVRALGAEIHSLPVDVADRAAVVGYAKEVHTHFGVVHQLYNNAGIASGAGFLDTDYELFDRVLAVNLSGVISCTKEFLPRLIESGDGHLVNVSSLNGLLAQQFLGAYCTSKFAVRGFTESVRAEMLSLGHPVRVTVVHPGGVATNIARSAVAPASFTADELALFHAGQRMYERKLLRMPADRAAEIIVRGVERGKKRILVGSDARALDRVVRLLPTAYISVLVRAERLVSR